MLVKLSDPMRREIEATVRSKGSESRVVDVFGVAEKIRLRFVDDDVALEDIAAMVADLAAKSGCALELDRRELLAA